MKAQSERSQEDRQSRGNYTAWNTVLNCRCTDVYVYMTHLLKESKINFISSKNDFTINIPFKNQWIDEIEE